MTSRALRMTGLVGVLVFLDLVLWSAVSPLLSYWGDAIGMTKSQAGLVAGVYSGAIVLASIPAGHMADRLGAKKVTLAATLLFALTAPLTGYADAVWQVIVLRLLQGIFSAVSWSAGIAWLAAAVGSDHRSRAIGAVNAVVPLGMVAGPVLGGPLVDRFGPRASLTGFGVIVAVLFVALALQADAIGETHEGLSLRATVRASLRDTWLLVANVALFACAFGQTLVQTLGPLRLDALGLSQSAIGYVFVAIALTSLVVTVTTIRLTRRRARQRPHLIAIAVVIAGLIGAALALPLGAATYVIVLVVYAAPQTVAFVSSYALTSDGAERSGVGQGVAMAMLSTTWGIGAFLSPTLLAPVASATSDRLVFGLIAILMVTAGIALVVLARRGSARAMAEGRALG